MILTRLASGYEAFDSSFAGGWLPGGATREEASAQREILIRAIAPDPVEDAAVGWNRITTDTVGGTDPYTGEQWPTWSEAWRETDQTFNGWLPGGEDPDLPDPLADLGKKLLAAAVLIGLAAVSR